MVSRTNVDAVADAVADTLHAASQRVHTCSGSHADIDLVAGADLAAAANLAAGADCAACTNFAAAADCAACTYLAAAANRPAVSDCHPICDAPKSVGNTHGESVGYALAQPHHDGVPSGGRLSGSDRHLPRRLGA